MLKKVQDEIVELMNQFIEDSNKKPTKAGHKRMRAATIKLQKLGKQFRQLSIEEDSK